MAHRSTRFRSVARHAAVLVVAGCSSGADDARVGGAGGGGASSAPDASAGGNEAGGSTAGRQTLRERVAVEHRLAHVGRKQGRRARYLGVRKNLFDLRRAAAIVNLETIDRRVADAA